MQINKVIELNTSECIDGSRVGRVIQRDDDGQIWIDFAKNPRGPLLAKVCDTVCRKLSIMPDVTDIDVLLVFEESRSDMPVVIDIIHTTVDAYIKETTIEPQESTNNLPSTEVLVDGRKVIFDAEEQLELRCGKSSITLTKNGKVQIRGAYVLTRSSGVNHIKGGSVKIN